MDLLSLVAMENASIKSRAKAKMALIVEALHDLDQDTVSAVVCVLQCPAPQGGCCLDWMKFDVES